MRARQRQHCPCYDSQVEPLELLYHERYKSKINPTQGPIIQTYPELLYFPVSVYE